MMYDAINMRTKQQQRKSTLTKAIKGLRNVVALSLVGVVMGAGLVYGLDKEMDIHEQEGQYVAAKFNQE